MELREIQEEPDGMWKDMRSSTDDLNNSTPTSSHADAWPLSRPDSHLHSKRSLDVEQGRGSQSSVGYEVEPVGDQGLSPPPRR